MLFILRLLISFAIIMLSMQYFGNTFLVGWLSYIVYDITDKLVVSAYKKEPDESK
jgi:hypothetical protein